MKTEDLVGIDTQQRRREPLRVAESPFDGRDAQIRINAATFRPKRANYCGFNEDTFCRIE